MYETITSPTSKQRQHYKGRNSDVKKQLQQNFSLFSVKLNHRWKQWYLLKIENEVDNNDIDGREVGCGGQSRRQGQGHQGQYSGQVKSISNDDAEDSLRIVRHNQGGITFEKIQGRVCFNNFKNFSADLALERGMVQWCDYFGETLTMILNGLPVNFLLFDKQVDVFYTITGFCFVNN